MAEIQFRTTERPARPPGTGVIGAGHGGQQEKAPGRPTGPHLSGYSFPALTILLALLLIIPWGCAPLEQRKTDFIARRNSEIGTPYSTAGLPDPIEVKSLGNGKTYYLFEDQKTGCRWSCEVNAEKGTIEYWLYEGNPNLCYY
jgi:hypothetical protein